MACELSPSVRVYRARLAILYTVGSVRCLCSVQGIERSVGVATVKRGLRSPLWEAHALQESTNVFW